jgi:glutamine synthetase
MSKDESFVNLRELDRDRTPSNNGSTEVGQNFWVKSLDRVHNKAQVGARRYEGVKTTSDLADVAEHAFDYNERMVGPRHAEGSLNEQVEAVMPGRIRVSVPRALDSEKQTPLTSRLAHTTDASSFSTRNGKTVGPADSSGAQVIHSPRGEHTFTSSEFPGSGGLHTYGRLLDAKGRPMNMDMRALASRMDEYLASNGSRIENLEKFAGVSSAIGQVGVGVGCEREFMLTPYGTSLKDHMELSVSSGALDPNTQNYMSGSDLFATTLLTALRKVVPSVEGVHKEVAFDQYEIMQRFDEGVKNHADEIDRTRKVVEEVANLHELHVFWEPKPIKEAQINSSDGSKKVSVNGNGSHTNISLFDKVDGVKRNLFVKVDDQGKPVFREDGRTQLSELGEAFIGGILLHAKVIQALLNPTANSYDRLDPHCESPTFVCAAPDDNRGSMVRVSSTDKPEQTRIEVRVVDNTADLQVAISALLLAGLDGVKKGLTKESYKDQVIEKNVTSMTAEEKQKLEGPEGKNLLHANIEVATNALKEAVGNGNADFLYKGNVFSKELLQEYIAVRLEPEVIKHRGHVKHSTTEADTLAKTVYKPSMAQQLAIKRQGESRGR